MISQLKSVSIRPKLHQQTLSVEVMKQTERYGLLDHIKWIDEILYEASWFVEVLDRRRRCCLILLGSRCLSWSDVKTSIVIGGRDPCLLPCCLSFTTLLMSLLCAVPLSVLAASAFSLSVLCLCPPCLSLSLSLSLALSLSLSLSLSPSLPLSLSPFLLIQVLLATGP